MRTGRQPGRILHLGYIFFPIVGLRTLRSVKIQGFIHEVRAFAVLIDIINDKKISGVRGFGIN